MEGKSCSAAEHHVKAHDYKLAGNEKFNNSNYKGAVVDYKRGLLHESHNCDLHANLAAAYIHLEKFLEAEEHALYAIHLRPQFHKGYMRAAKAAHGKGMTKLALKHLKQGLTAVIDANGIKELKRLTCQYEAFLSLESNAEREMNFDSDRYQSEDEDDDEEVSDDGDSDDDPFPFNLQQDRGHSKKLAKLMKQVDLIEKQNTPPLLYSQPIEPKINPSVPIATVPPSTSTSKAPTLPEKKMEARRGKREATPPKEESDQNEELEKPDEELEKPDEELEKPEEIQEEDLGNGSKNAQGKEHLGRLKELIKPPDSKQHVADFKDNLKCGSEAFLSCNYRKAVECYKAAKERVGTCLSDFEIDDRQYSVIKYAYATSLINLGTYDDIVRGLQELNSMEVCHLSIPALYIQMSKAHTLLNRFKTAFELLEKLQEILDNFQIFPTFTWPGTSEIILETTPSGLKDALKALKQSSRMSHKPTAVCRFKNCLKVSTHILPSECIYTSDPDFVGYVRLICEEKCHIDFHITCWKLYKEEITDVGKLTDKDFLGRRCLTTDCVSGEGDPSVITVIEIFGSDGEVKSVTKTDNKESVDSKMAKKRKSKHDEKEKLSKTKKTKDKKVRELKKPSTIVEEEDDAALQSERASILVHADAAKALQTRKASYAELRKLKFGHDPSKSWNPMKIYYGRDDEVFKTSANIFLDASVNDAVEVKDAKEFLFSYFVPILKEEGPIRQEELETHWKEAAGGFCDIKVVLPNIKSMCELLLESTRFCWLENYICLSEQLDECYETVKLELSSVLAFEAGEISTSQSTPISTSRSADLPDLLSHPQPAHTAQFASQSSSEDEMESDEESDESENSDESEEESEEDEPEVKAVAQVDSESFKSTPSSFVSPAPPADARSFTVENLMSQLSQMKSMMGQPNDTKGSDEEDHNEKEIEMNKEGVEQQNDTFETAYSSSLESDGCKFDMGTEVDASKLVKEEELADDEELNFGDDLDTQDIDADEICAPDTQLLRALERKGSGDSGSVNDKKSGNDCNGSNSDESLNSKNDGERDKAVQSAVTTEERHIQTTPMETKDRLSQTKESDLYRDLTKHVQELTMKLAMAEKNNQKLAHDLGVKDAFIKQLKSAHDNNISSLHEQTRKLNEVQKAHQEKCSEFSKKEAAHKHKEEEMKTNSNKLRELYASTLAENNKMKEKLGSLLKDLADTKEKHVLTLNNLKEYEKQYNALGSSFAEKIQKTLQSQLVTIKAHWDGQITMLKKRCVEKISDMQNWFSMFSMEGVEELPSWGAIYHNIKKYNEICSAIQKLENDFQLRYSEAEHQINCGNVEDLSTFTLPTLPEEPPPLPLGMITKEITEKYVKRSEELAKKVSDLTQLVVSQQLEIEKSKEHNQQIQQMMNSFQMVQPRVQTPMTTAFGSLALQYSYPPGAPQFGQPPVAAPPHGQTFSVPPPSKDTTLMGSTAKPLHTDVQALLQESSKAITFSGMAAGKPPNMDLGGLSFTSPPPPLATHLPSQLNYPPPPMGVAHNLLKASANAAVKEDTKVTERSATPKLEAAKSLPSRETTPVPSTATPEKTKKKKKSKAEALDAAEARLAMVAGLESAAAVDHGVTTAPTEDTEWSVVGFPKVKPTPVSAAPQLSDSKMKNKKKLLDKLSQKFPTSQLKDLDEVVKLVRDQNNGSLSGLPYAEIEARVERFMNKKLFQKTSKMGLDKFSMKAWGTMKPQETVARANLQLEECIVCLELMSDNDRTRIDCNHEFHTVCLRKWLKEKRVCPLCQKFAAMPDEFPAL